MSKKLKHTMEYAIKMAELDAAFLPDYADIVLCKNQFIDGYMEAIKQTAVPDMLEALMNIENDNNSIPAPIWKMIQDAIKKATE